MPSSNKPTPPDLQDFQAALDHVDQNSKHMAESTAKGLLYSLIETLGVLVGDPDLPEHLKSGYDGVLESAHELSARLNQPKS